MSIGGVSGVGGGGNIQQPAGVTPRQAEESPVAQRGDGVDVDLRAPSSAAPAAPPAGPPAGGPAPPSGPAPGPAGPSVPTTLFDEGVTAGAASETSGSPYLALAGG